MSVLGRLILLPLIDWLRLYSDCEDQLKEIEEMKLYNPQMALISNGVHSSGRRGGLRVSVLDSGLNDAGSSHGRGHCVEFLGKTLYSHSFFLLFTLIVPFSKEKYK